MLTAVFRIVLAFASFTLLSAVKHSDFRSCAQSGFCQRNRAIAESIIKNGAKAEWSAGQVQLSADGTVSFVLERLETRLQAHLHVFAEDVIRFRLDPISGNSASLRYRIPEGDVIVAKESGSLIVNEGEDIIRIANSPLKLKLTHSPFSLELLSELDSDAQLLHLNAENLLNFETGQ